LATGITNRYPLPALPLDIPKTRASALFNVNEKLAQCSREESGDPMYYRAEAHNLVRTRLESSQVQRDTPGRVPKRDPHAQINHANTSCLT
jgi:hypothetical protein